MLSYDKRRNVAWKSNVGMFKTVSNLVYLQYSKIIFSCFNDPSELFILKKKLVKSGKIKDIKYTKIPKKGKRMCENYCRKDLKKI